MNDKFNGQVVTYSEDASSGVVRDHIGRHYVFHASDWIGAFTDLIDGIDVEFDTGSGRAMRIMKKFA